MDANSFTKVSKLYMPLMSDVMERNQFATSWEQLSEEDLETVNGISNRYLDEYNYVEAYKDGVLSQEEYDLIQRFSDWNDYLGGYDE